MRERRRFSRLESIVQGVRADCQLNRRRSRRNFFTTNRGNELGIPSVVFSPHQGLRTRLDEAEFDEE
jgi:hypothetical protein